MKKMQQIDRLHKESILLENLDISKRVVYALRNDDVYKVRDLLSKTPQHLIKFRTVGIKGLINVRKVLKELGFSAHECPFLLPSNWKIFREGLNKKNKVIYDQVEQELFLKTIKGKSFRQLKIMYFMNVYKLSKEEASKFYSICQKEGYFDEKNKLKK